MAMKDEDIKKALRILEQFERQAIDPALFEWEYLVKHVGFSRVTLWRKEEIKTRFGEVRDYLDQINRAASPFTYERMQRIKSDQETDRLKNKKDNLEIEVDMLREQLAYAASVAEKKGLDPMEFFRAPKRRQLKDGK